MDMPRSGIEYEMEQDRFVPIEPIIEGAEVPSKTTFVFQGTTDGLATSIDIAKVIIRGL